MVEENGGFEKHDIWVLDTVGSNLLGVLALDFIDQERTTSNDIMEIYNVLGIEAARNAIITELIEVIEFDNTYVNYHHFNLLADRMTYRSKMMAISRNGLNNDDIGPIVKASFEETPEMFMRAGKFGELDTLNGVSANVMCGQEGMFGTNAFQVVLDLEHMETLNAQNEYTPPKNYDEEVNDAFMMDDVDGSSNISTSVINADRCRVNKITIRNNIANIIDKTLESDDEEYDPGF
jgi:DNA-directed RNA polymerase II subunit RPB1